ncbi:hypothetical protein [Aureibacter tunicatorum]|uniref:Lipoprotein n=1 Tax=Aureibacter tunicatorum TaxID=866807 RepID=A0AAE3XQT5_9BACT|nr:hypothetical protein [Aureibacter tunicatorum]MDR6240329.1 hypothetical protein [Aureibacter tunicatorum]BDD05790.1 hypothetical protein AUTU_32730 [Aureibacter tunicatorum]
MNKLFLILAVVFAFASCQSKKSESKENSKTENNNSATVAEKPIKEKEEKHSIPFTIAQNYFVKNDVDKLKYPKLKSEEEFDKIFGSATTMGKEGKPTKIDFDKQFVIAVVLPETKYSTTIEPVSLKKKDVDELVFTYKVDTGEKQSYTIKPSLAIIVDKSHHGIVVVKEAK